MKHDRLDAGNQSRHSKPKSTLPRDIAIGGTACLLVALVIVAFFLVKVSDEQLTETGQVVPVSRHLQLSDPPVVAVGILLLGLLSVFVTEVSAFGVSIKRIVSLEKAATRLEIEQDQLQETVDDFGEANKLILESDRSDSQTRQSDTPVARLAEEYNDVRYTMRANSARTREMTRIVEEMRRELQGTSELDVPNHLASPNRGLRLAGYAYLYDRPQSQHAALVVNTFLDREDKPFGQYWGLKALQQIVASDARAIDSVSFGRLKRRLQDLPYRSDRATVLRKILRDVGP